MNDRETVFNESPISWLYGRSETRFMVLPEQVIKVIEDYFEIPYKVMKLKTRKREVVFPRQVCMFLMCFHTNLSLIKIGEHFSSKDHTTVIHARETIKNLMSSTPVINETVFELKRLLSIYAYRAEKTKHKPILNIMPKVKSKESYLPKVKQTAQVVQHDYKRPPAVYSNKSPYHIAS